MKHYSAYKKQFKLVLLALLLVLPLAFSSAQTAEEVKSKIEQSNNDIERLEKEIKAYQSQLNDLGKQKDSLSVQIKELDINKKKLAADISITQKKIDKTSLTIQSLGGQIGTKQNAIDNANEAIAIEIRKKNEFELDNELFTLLSENDFTVVWNDIDNMADIREKIREKIIELREVKGELEDTRQETVAAKNELTSLKNKLADQKKIVDQNTAEKNKLLSQTKNSEAAYQKLLAQQVAQKLALEAQVRDYESQLKFILDPSKLPTSGVLAWPLDNVFVTQLFGKTVDSKRLYASGTHSGVDFRASIGTPVKAMADGVVGGAGDTDVTCPAASFGKWIFIEYDNGLSNAFGHLSLIKVGKGQKVKRGEVVGYSGSTGHVTGPHLHVSVYAPNAASVQTIPSKACVGRTLTQPIAATNGYLDPMYYLPPYKN